MPKRSRSPTPVLNSLPPTKRLTRRRDRNDRWYPLTLAGYNAFLKRLDILVTAVEYSNQMQNPFPTFSTAQAERKETGFYDLPQEIRVMIFTVAANTARAKWFRRKRRALLRNLEMPDSWGFTPSGNTEIFLTGHHKWSISEASVDEEVHRLYLHEYYPQGVILEIQSGLPTGVFKRTDAFVIPEDDFPVPAIDPDDPIQEYWMDVM